MAKYQDRSKSKLPTDVKYIKGEPSNERHNRRQIENCKALEKLQNYCKSNKFKLTVTNEGMHWQICRGKIVIDWWPRTAKMIVNKKWKQGIHVHDIKQLISYLEFVKLL